MDVLAIPLGVLIGVSLGALGGGGSILTVPALVYALGQGTHAATTGSLIIVGITSLAGMVAHMRAGRVQFRAGMAFGVLGVAGSYLGSRASASVDPNALLVGFSVLMMVAAISMLRRRKATSGGAPSGAGFAGSDSTAEVVALPVGGPGGRGRSSGSVTTGGVTGGEVVATLDAEAEVRGGISVLRVLVAATVVGLVTGFFGVGGGFVVVPALVLALRFDMPQAVGTSLLVIAINSASALVSRLSGHPHIDAAVLVPFTLAAIAGTVFGSRLASRLRPERLVGAFTVLLVVIAIYTASRSLPHLL